MRYAYSIWVIRYGYGIRHLSMGWQWALGMVGEYGLHHGLQDIISRVRTGSGYGMVMAYDTETGEQDRRTGKGTMGTSNDGFLLCYIPCVDRPHGALQWAWAAVSWSFSH